MTLPEPLGDRVRRFRMAQGLTQEDLAARMQTRGHDTIMQPRIAEIELGRRSLTPEELVDMARALGVAITELLGVPDKL